MKSWGSLRGAGLTLFKLRQQERVAHPTIHVSEVAHPTDHRMTGSYSIEMPFLLLFLSRAGGLPFRDDRKSIIANPCMSISN